MIKHCRVAYKDAEVFLAKAHDKQYFFGNTNTIRKTVSTVSSSNAPASRGNQKKFVKNENGDDAANEEDSRLGKRPRSTNSTMSTEGSVENISSNSNTTPITVNQTSLKITTGDNLSYAAKKDSQEDPSKLEFLLTCMYGYSQHDKKKEQWSFIQQISTQNSSPWIVLGDLNFHILDSSNSTSSSMDGWVNNLVANSGLEDIGFVGKDYTWTSNNLGTGTMRSRIDMALGNGEWNTHFPNSKLFHLTQELIAGNLLKIFLPGLMIMLALIILLILGKNNVVASPGFQLVKKLQFTRKDLSKWNMEHFGDINIKVDNLQKELDVLQAQPQGIVSEEQIKSINLELSKWNKTKSEFYHQKSREHFIKDMDNNSKYFHTRTNRKRTRNNIDSIKNHNNVRLHSREQISSHLTSHFREISTSTSPILEDDYYHVLPTVINSEDNSLLTRIPSQEEIFSTLKSMQNWSVPGPEGFQAGFYKSQWDTVGTDVCQMVSIFFETKHILKQINNTYISLIPKKKKCISAADYRPIGLRNTSYKIISKILVGRMEPLMPKIVSPFQAAYVSGRLISDNM
ncbi:uncharacterized protein LOC113290782 [Papaver somniferum]|uniref:uncharacterized protein LOC113290782 n=1 Tax=Papaver somniferum TaxID=3469 RepID=UPI000E704574|nr:uncharacterized protein LOC113290782 [Papaver somniferum]